MQTGIKEAETGRAVVSRCSGQPFVKVRSVNPGLRNFNYQELVINPSETFGENNSK